MKRAGAALVVACTVACSSFREGDTAEVTPVDGGMTAPDAGAAIDDGGAPDALAPPVCPVNALLCERFDEGLANWSGAVSAFRIEAVNGNNILRLSVGPRGGAGPYDVSLTRALSGTLAGVRLSFMLRVAAPAFTDAGGDNANFALVRVENGGPGSKMFGGLFLSNGGARANTQLTVDTDTGGRGTGMGTISYGDWHRGVIEIRLGAAGVLGFRFDQDEMSTQTMTTDAVLELAVSLGVYRPNDDTPPISVDFDDIVAEAL